MRIAGTPKTIDAPRQPTAAMIGAPMSATTTVPTLPPAMWALIAKPRRSGGNCSARRPLPTGCWGEPPIRDRTLATANPPNVMRERLGDEAAAEQEAAGPEQLRRGEPPGQRRVAQLDGARGEAAERGEEGDRLDADTEVLRDLDVDQRQDERLGVVDGVGDRQQPERAHRPDDDPVGGIGERGGGRDGRQPHRPR